MTQLSPISWLKGIWPRQEEYGDVPTCDTPIVVHYTRYRLPPPIDSSEESDGDVDVGGAIEVVLEPYVLWCSLLRSVTGCKLRLSPSVYDEFVGGAMPAAYVGDPTCYGGAPLRQESLMSHLLLNVPTGSEEVRRQLSSRFTLYDGRKKTDGSAEATREPRSYHTGSSILPVYVEKHLRYAVLFFIWVFPKISQNVTKRIVVNSTPWPYGYYVFNKRSREIAKACAQCGYSDVAFTLKELALMLRELQRILQNELPSLNHRCGVIAQSKA
ncbi:metaxin 2, putative [Babesia ovata]|uniref:Metaxin 2, putative n=1 Tax=Babesia ovata TaxID=189622 RepID=A0A2H6KII5_9APIC|nr:metaxin 2, putative [Babesia ovata]GBE62791.1 metaxin 2, putative [Babesia ovata]